MQSTFGSGRSGSALALAFGAFTLAALPAGPVAIASAQTATESTDVRLRRVEAELRAVQRKVFPDGAGKSFQPELAPSANGTTGAPSSSTPAPTGLTDLLTRMEAVEAQLQRLTAATEENQNYISKLEVRLAALETANSPAAVGATPVSQPAVASAVPNAPAVVSEPPKPPAKPVLKPSAAKPDASTDRMAAVMAVEKPATDDKGEDEYSYGYRLWEAKFFPEAQQQLLRVVQQHPRHARISYARNLLGRAYLDDGKPGTAAQYFLQNYQADRKGDRAADSLLYLGVAMGRLKEEKRACVAFSEFWQNYPTEAAGRLKSQYEAAVKPLNCN